MKSEIIFTLTFFITMVLCILVGFSLGRSVERENSPLINESETQQNCRISVCETGEKIMRQTTTIEDYRNMNREEQLDFSYPCDKFNSTVKDIYRVDCQERAREENYTGNLEAAFKELGIKNE